MNCSACLVWSTYNYLLMNIYLLFHKFGLTSLFRQKECFLWHFFEPLGPFTVFWVFHELHCPPAKRKRLSLTQRVQIAFSSDDCIWDPCTCYRIVFDFLGTVFKTFFICVAPSVCCRVTVLPSPPLVILTIDRWSWKMVTEPGLLWTVRLRRVLTHLSVQFSNQYTDSWILE